VSLPPEESASLRNYRKIVGAKYSDFQARVPGCEPPIIVSLAASEDGTTKDSKYPNLMLDEVRMQHGI
jgi:hypothetical protein